MGQTGIDRSVQPYYDHAMDDRLHLNYYQKINANNNNISDESRTFADNVEAIVIDFASILAKREEVALAA